MENKYTRSNNEASVHNAAAVAVYDFGDSVKIGRLWSYTRAGADAAVVGAVTEDGDACVLCATSAL